MAEDALDVAALSSTLAEKGATWVAGETLVSVLPSEQRRLYLGATPPEHAPGLEERERIASANATAPARSYTASAPTGVDLKNYVRPVRNQGQCGSCVAFGTIAAVEGTARVEAEDAALAVDLSEAQLFYCHAKVEGRNCRNGWWPDNALDALRDKGVVDEACFPYTAGDQNCTLCSDADERNFKLTSWKGLQAVDEMKTWLATKGPLVACFTVYEDFYAYRSGIYRHATGAQVGGHCVCVAGYSDNDRAWIAKNSWSTSWGEEGFFRIGYGDCGIDYAMWGVEVPKVETAEWLKRRAVTGIWAINETRNAAAYIAGVGWKRIGGTDDADFLAVLGALDSARTSKTLVDVRLTQDKIVEVYVF
jgi:C1A family cysteine protease